MRENWLECFCWPCCLLSDFVMRSYRLDCLNIFFLCSFHWLSQLCCCFQSQCFITLTYLVKAWSLRCLRFEHMWDSMLCSGFPFQPGLPEARQESSLRGAPWQGHRGAASRICLLLSVQQRETVSPELPFGGKVSALPKLWFKKCMQRRCLEQNKQFTNTWKDIQI